MPTTIRLGLFEDETSRLCRWHLPQAHYLESWGDVRAWDGTVSVQQPLIEALYGGRAPIELLAELLGGSVASGYEIVRATLKETLAAPDFEAAWRRALHDGVVAGLAAPSSGAGGLDRTGSRISHGSCSPQNRANTAPPAGMTVVFAADASVYDGRFANNAWLQEMPDPLTKITWDNAALREPDDGGSAGRQARRRDQGEARRAARSRSRPT